MDKIIIAGNWKSNKTVEESRMWFDEMNGMFSQAQKTVIVCPGYTSLSFFAEKVKNENLSLGVGAQNISPFGPGAYTGEVSAEQVKEFATYVIIGHSERRNYFKEDDQILEKKLAVALAASLIPIFCVQGDDTFVPKGVDIVAYEPIWAIGTGKAESPKQANTVAGKIKEKTGASHILYGGSVSAENVHSFTQETNISGVLVGGVSLHPQEFSQLIANA